MPVTISAQKKLRKDKKRTIVNEQVRLLVKKAIKKARKSPAEKTVRVAFSLIDQAVTKHLFHKNKAARIKSSLSKLLTNKVKPATPVSKPKSTPKKKK